MVRAREGKDATLKLRLIETVDQTFAWSDSPPCVIAPERTCVRRQPGGVKVPTSAGSLFVFEPDIVPPHSFRIPVAIEMKCEFMHSLCRLLSGFAGFVA